MNIIDELIKVRDFHLSKAHEAQENIDAMESEVAKRAMRFLESSGVPSQRPSLPENRNPVYIPLGVETTGPKPLSSQDSDETLLPWATAAGISIAEMRGRLSEKEGLVREGLIRNQAALATERKNKAYDNPDLNGGIGIVKSGAERKLDPPPETP